MTRRRIAFLDASPIDYGPGAPECMPLGGSQTSVCLLIRDLIAAGRPVLLANNAGTRRDGPLLRHVAFRSLSTADLSDVGTVVFVNFLPARADAAVLPDTMRRVLWMHNAPTSRTADRLQDAEHRARLARVVVPSHWSAAGFVERFGLAPGQVATIRNHVHPAFAGLCPPDRRIGDGKVPGRLLYASMPNRGLQVLEALFPRIRAARPHATLEVFSGFILDQGMAVAAPAAAQSRGRAADPEALLARLAAQPGITVHRGVAKPVLAAHMARAEVLAYPCTFPETECVTAIEACLAGCLPVVTDAGALPETLGRNGLFAHYDAATDRLNAGDYVDQTVRALDRLAAGGGRMEAVLRRQVDSVRRRYLRGRQSAQWRALLEAPAE